MQVAKLVAALVLRVGIDGKTTSMTWANLADVLDLTPDQIRHRLTAFKKKYNIVDQDVVEGWNRTFLFENAPEDEKEELDSMSYWPGDVVTYYGDTTGVILAGFDQGGSQEEFEVVEFVADTGHFTVPSVRANDINTPDPVDMDVPLKRVVPVSKKDFVGGQVAVLPKKVVEAPQFLITPACLIVVRDAKPLSIDKSHKNFDRIKAALDTKNWQQVFDLIDMKTTLTNYSNGRVVVQNGGVTLDGVKVAGKLSDRLINSLMEENLEALDALGNFLVKCDDNPDARVLQRLFSFMAAKDIRLDKDGDFYAYKVVRSNYLDKHSGTMDNKPGQTVKMKRNQVNPIDSETCSSGLHVCSKSYIEHFSSGGDRVVLCKVNPRDVVSVPSDYGDAKMRTCEYVVIKDVTENFVDGDQPGVKPIG